MNLVVFDLDHTLLTVNSSYHFGHYLYKQNFFSFKNLILSLMDYIKHKRGKICLLNLHLKIFERLFKGNAKLKIEQHVEQFLLKNLTSFFNQPLLKRLKEYQDKGDKVIILSSSPDFLVKEIAGRLNVDHWMSTFYQANAEGILSEVTDIMEGESKALYIKNIIKNLNCSVLKLIVYTDSYLDLPLLELAHQPIGVNPDKYLKKICLKRGWEIF